MSTFLIRISINSNILKNRLQPNRAI